MLDLEMTFRSTDEPRKKRRKKKSPTGYWAELIRELIRNHITEKMLLGRQEI